MLPQEYVEITETKDLDPIRSTSALRYNPFPTHFREKEKWHFTYTSECVNNGNRYNVFRSAQ